MSTYNQRIAPSGGHLNIGASLRGLFSRVELKRSGMFGAIIIIALLAFEAFNYSTTEFALSDLLGELKFAGIGWATILALAFCGMDFAGIARLFTPQRGDNQSMESWYILGAWFLAATMNALLTWWAVSLALIGHTGLGNEVLGREQLLESVPIFVAVLVWLIRILMIGSFTLAGANIFKQDARRSQRFSQKPSRVRSVESDQAPFEPTNTNNRRRPVRPAPKPVPHREPNLSPRPMSAQPRNRR
jgi:hypothetical protein